MFVCIWCEDKDHGIAKDNKLPWHLPEEMQHFRQTTLNHKIIMGRNTYLTLNKPLPHRINYVACNDLNYKNDDVNVVYNLNDFINKYKDSSEVIYVIGGKQIYQQMIPFSQALIVSRLNESYDCDLFLDNVDYSQFKLIRIEPHNSFTIYYYEHK